MYEPYFKFTRRPFPPVAVDELYFPGEAIEQARVTLSRCIRRAEGSGVVIGPTGTGKTMLCCVLARELREQFRVVHLASGRLSSRRSLLQGVLYSLGQPYRGLDEGEARLAVYDYLATSDECPEGIVLLVDEAHTLPLRLLDEVRMTTNLARDGRPLVRLVLAGSCALEERLATPKLDSFNQRIVARCYLESLSRDESVQYIRAQLEAAGAMAESVFPEEACRTVHRATDGVPRLINQLCDHTLLMACAAGAPRIESPLVEEAWADLQQLPTPWSVETPTSAAPADQSVIEFGGLDDEPAVKTSAAPSSDANDDNHDNDDDLDDLGGGMTLEFDGADDTSDAIPALRISAFDDDDEETDHVDSTEPIATADETDLTGRVDQIARLLDESTASIEIESPTTVPEPNGTDASEDVDRDNATADDDFRPAGTIGPEVELRFKSSPNPFDEEFDDEEVIEDTVQRETAIASTAVAASTDGDDSGRRQAENDVRAEPPKAQEVPVVFVELYDATPRSPVPELVLVDDDDDDLGGTDESGPADENAEDDTEPAIAGRTDQPPVVPVRRGQYRQLFAKLRRG